MSQLQWEPTPHRVTKTDEIADTGAGRYRIIKTMFGWRTTFNGVVIASQKSDAKYARQAASEHFSRQPQ